MTTFCLVSDTHGHHGNINIPKVDYLIHCGDATNVGRQDELIKFNTWCRKLKQEGTVKGIIFVPGNHDLTLESRPDYAVNLLQDIDHILIHRGIEIDGLKIWGCPYVPQFFQWAFMRSESDLYWIYNQIPVNLDILICHGPPFGLLDWQGREHAGSHAMAEILPIKAPKYYICGHIHESRGVEKYKNTTIINAANMDRNYQPLPAMVLKM